MTIKDPLYGNVTIINPLIIKIINLPVFQRLKDISQYGAVNFVYKDSYQTNRFEHSIGVWHVLNTLGASQEAQIAGLLHDVGHTAFSHLIDQAMQSKTEDYHERFVHLIKGYDELNALLKSENMQLKSVDEYSELKIGLPLIGADRFDYALRDFAHSTLQYDNFPQKALNDISRQDGKIIFHSVEIAEEFAKRGLKAMWNVIYDPKVAIIYQSAIELLREGMHEGTITPEHLIGTDSELMKVILEKAETFDSKYIKVFKQTFKAEIVSEDPYDFMHVKLKARYFDPLVFYEGRVEQLSVHQPSYKVILEEYKEKFAKRIDGEKIRVKWV